MALIAFDIETSDVFDLKPGEDLEKYAPFHVAVAATADSAGMTSVWLSRDSVGAPLNNMTRATARELLAHLRELQVRGDRVCAWNGASFDLRWIAHAADDIPTARAVAMDLYDPMFQFFNRTGFPVGLEAVARGMGLPMSKPMKSEDAPRLWCHGQHQAVLDYVCSDALMTVKIVEQIEQQRSVRWVPRKGGVKSEPIVRLLTVGDVLKQPEPDQSWMDKPLRRGHFVAWMGRV